MRGIQPVTRSFDVFFDVRLNKRLSKQSGRRWFETPSPSLWRHFNGLPCIHVSCTPFGCSDVMTTAMESQITSVTIVYSTVYSGADQRKHQSSVSLAFVRGIHRSPVNSPLIGPVTRKMFSFDDVIMRRHLYHSRMCLKSMHELRTYLSFCLTTELYWVPKGTKHRNYGAP